MRDPANQQGMTRRLMQVATQYILVHIPEEQGTKKQTNTESDSSSMSPICKFPVPSRSAASLMMALVFVSLKCEKAHAQSMSS